MSQTPIYRCPTPTDYLNVRRSHKDLAKADLSLSLSANNTELFRTRTRDLAFPFLIQVKLDERTVASLQTNPFAEQNNSAAEIYPCPSVRPSKTFLPPYLDLPSLLSLSHNVLWLGKEAMGHIADDLWHSSGHTESHEAVL